MRYVKQIYKLANDFEKKYNKYAQKTPLTPPGYKEPIKFIKDKKSYLALINLSEPSYKSEVSDVVGYLEDNRKSLISHAKSKNISYFIPSDGPSEEDEIAYELIDKLNRGLSSLEDTLWNRINYLDNRVEDCMIWGRRLWHHESTDEYNFGEVRGILLKIPTADKIKQFNTSAVENQVMKLLEEAQRQLKGLNSSEAFYEIINNFKTLCGFINQYQDTIKWFIDLNVTPNLELLK